MLASPSDILTSPRHPQRKLRPATKCASTLKKLVGQLERAEEQEVLRKPLKDLGLFLPGKDPDTAHIGLDELKRLIRHWKLHEKGGGGFWRDQDAESLAHILINHIRQQGLYRDQRPALTAPSVLPQTTTPSAGVSPLRRHQQQNVRRENRRTSYIDRILRPYNGDLFSTLWETTDGIALMSRYSQPERTAAEIGGQARRRARRKSRWQEAQMLGTTMEQEQKGVVARTSSVSFVDRGRQRTMDSYSRSRTLTGDSSGARSSMSQDDHCSTDDDSDVDAADEVKEAEILDMARKVVRQLYSYSCAKGSEVAMVGEGALDVVSAMAHLPCPQVVAHASAALSNIACNAEARAFMLTHETIRKCIAPLIDSEYSSRQSRLHAAQALYKLTLEDNSELNVQAEGMSALSSMCGIEDGDETRQVVASSLINILVGPLLVHQQKVRILELVSPILSMLCVAPSPDSNNALCVASAALEVSRIESVRKESIETGIVSVVAAQLRLKPASDIVALTALALRNLTATTECLPAILDAHALSVMPLLAVHENPSVRTCAADIGRNLTQSTALLPRLERAGMISILIRLTETPTARPAAVLALSSMTLGAEGLLRRLVREGGHRILIETAQGGTIAVEAAASGLCNLLSLPDNCDALLSSGLLRALTCSAGSTRIDAQRAAALMAHNLACLKDQSMDKMLQTDEIVLAVVHLAESKDDAEVRRQAIKSLSCLSTDPRVCFLLAKEQGLFTSLLYFKTEYAMHQTLAALLSNMSCSPTLHKHMHEGGCMSLLLEICRGAVAPPTSIATSNNHKKGGGGGGASAALGCAMTLSNFAQHSSDAVADDIITGIRELIRCTDTTDSHEVRLRCCQALMYLSANPNHVTKVSASGEIVKFMVTAMRSESSLTEQMVCITFCNLSCTADCASALLELGIVKDFIVVALLRSNANAIKEICSQVFYQLLRHPHMRTHVAEQGAVWALVKAGKEGTATNALLCTRALYNISCEKASADCLAGLQLLSILSSLTGIGDDSQGGRFTASNAGLRSEICLTISKFLCNICSQPPLAAELVSRSGLIQLVNGCIDAGGKSAKLFCAEALRSISIVCKSRFLIDDGIISLANCHFSDESMSKDVEAVDPGTAAMVTCFANLAEDEVCGALLAELGLVSWIFSARDVKGNSPTAALALRTCYDLVRQSDESQMSILMENNLVRGTVKFVSDCPGSTIVKEIAAKIILAVSYNENHHIALANHHTLACLTSMLVEEKEVPGTTLEIDVMMALRNASQQKRFAELLGRPDQLRNLASLTSIECQYLQAAIYQNISGSEFVCRSMANSVETMEALKKLSAADFDRGIKREGVRRCVAIAVYNLMACTMSELAASRAGAVQILTHISNTSTNEDTRHYCSVGISFRSSVALDTTEYNAGSIKALISLVTGQEGSNTPQRLRTSLLPVLPRSAPLPKFEMTTPAPTSLNLSAAWDWDASDTGDLLAQVPAAISSEVIDVAVSLQTCSLPSSSTWDGTQKSKPNKVKGAWLHDPNKKVEVSGTPCREPTRARAATFTLLPDEEEDDEYLNEVPFGDDDYEHYSEEEFE